MPDQAQKPSDDCANCGKPIERKRYWQRFCSHDCRQSWHKKEARKALEAFRAKQTVTVD